MKLNQILRVALVFTLLFLAGNELMAQGPVGGGPTGGTGAAGGPPPCWPPPCIPIDGGIGFLMLGGLAFGGKKAYDLKRKKDAQS